MPLGSFFPQPDGDVVPYEASQHAGERARRLQLVEAAYSLPMNDLLTNMVQRLEALFASLVGQSEAGDETYRRLVAEGHLDYYCQEVAFVRLHRSEW